MLILRPREDLCPYAEAEGCSRCTTAPSAPRVRPAASSSTTERMSWLGAPGHLPVPAVFLWLCLSAEARERSRLQRSPAALGSPGRAAHGARGRRAPTAISWPDGAGTPCSCLVFSSHSGFVSSSARGFRRKAQGGGGHRPYLDAAPPLLWARLTFPPAACNVPSGLGIKLYLLCFFPLLILCFNFSGYFA